MITPKVSLVKHRNKAAKLQTVEVSPKITLERYDVPVCTKQIRAIKVTLT